MGRTIFCQRDPHLASGQRLAVEFRLGDPTADAVGVLDRNFVARRGVSKHDFEARPVLGNAWREEQECSLKTKPKNRFDAGSIHPPGRASVPRPSAASDMRRFRIDIGGLDIMFGLLTMDACPRAGGAGGID